MNETDRPSVVERPDDITADWMTAALRSGGVEADVAELSFGPIGTGQMADSFRFELGYASSAKGAPNSVVVKLQSASEISRAAGASGGYDSEVRFYTELEPTLTIRTPACHCAIASDDCSLFALVLEDLAPAEQGNQIDGCSVDRAREAVVNLAGLHGPRWCDPSLHDLAWLRRASPESAAGLQAFLVNATEGFIERYGSRVPSQDASVLRAFAANAASWQSRLRGRFSAIHGDYRLDNLLFATSEGGYPVATVDWQTLEIGLPGRDLAYFLGNSLTADDRRKCERELVGSYHEALVAQGVAGHSADECFEDYRYGQFQGPLVTVLGAMVVKRTDRGDEMFMAMSSRACEAIRDLGSLDLL